MGGNDFEQHSFDEDDFNEIDVAEFLLRVVHLQSFHRLTTQN